MYYKNDKSYTFKETNRTYENADLKAREDVLRNMKNQLEWVKRQLEYVRYESLNRDNPMILRKGEIYEFDWGVNVRHEFSNRHYGVVLADSDYQNPLVLVCPLKTKHGEMHTKSDVFIGKIEGIHDDRDTIAVINQIRSLDKLRLYVRPIIQGDYSTKSVLRLTNEQLKNLLDGIAKYLY